MEHLSPELLASMMDGSLPAARRRALLEHAEACPVCEQMLQQKPDLDALIRMLAAEEALGEDDAQAQMTPKEQADVWQAIRPRSRRRWWIPLLAAAALLAIMPWALVEPTDPIDPQWSGIKGEPQAPEAELRVLSGRLVEGQLSLDGRVVDGQALSSDRLLIFVMEVDEPAVRYLFVVDGSGEASLLSASEDTAPPGPAAVMSGGERSALALDDMMGPLTLVAATSLAPLDAQAQVLAPFLAGAPTDAVSYQAMTIEVDR